MKNYLYFAEKRGAKIIPDCHVDDIKPLASADGSDGYVLSTRRPGAWIRRNRRQLTARGVVVAAGALGTNRLLANCKHTGSLPRISSRLGRLVRTNSESILAVTLPDDTLPDDSLEPWKSVAISASIHTDERTHIEFVTYGKHADFMSTLFTLLTGDGTRLSRPFVLLGQIVRHPIGFLRTLWPFGWSRRTLVFLVMQTLDNAIGFRARRKVRTRRATHHGAGPGEAQPHLHRRGQPLGRMARGADRRHCTEHRARGRGQYPDDSAHPGWRRDRA
jgi:cholesterol oxidase